MRSVFHIISEYFWLIALGFCAVNYARVQRDQGANAAAPGEQRSDTQAYLRRFALAAALPWVVMGAGQLSGWTPSVWYYFRPQDENPFVLAWLAIIFALSALYAWWVLFAGGARLVRELNLMALVGHPSNFQSECSIKLFALAGLLMPPVWVFLAVHMNAPLPKW